MARTPYLQAADSASPVAQGCCLFPPGSLLCHLPAGTAAAHEVLLKPEQGEPEVQAGFWVPGFLLPELLRSCSETVWGPQAMPGQDALSAASPVPDIWSTLPYAISTPKQGKTPQA